MSSDLPANFSASISVWALLAIGLGLIGVAILTSVALAGHDHKRSVWGSLMKSLNLVWVVPVFAVLALLVHRLGPEFAGASPVPLLSETSQLAVATPAEPETTVPVSTADDSSLPEWARQPRTTEGDSTFVVVSSRQFATVEEVEADVRAEALQVLKAELGLTGDATAWKFPERAVDFRLRHEEEITRSVGDVDFRVYRVHRQLEISPETREAVVASWRDHTADRRLWALGGLVGFATLITAASSAYLRLDTRTRGHYRGRLKLATVSLIVAGGLVAASVV